MTNVGAIEYLKLMQEQNYSENNPRYKALTLSIASLEREMVSVEDIAKIIIQKEYTPSVMEDSGQVEWSLFEARKLAQAIHQLITKGVV